MKEPPILAQKNSGISTFDKRTMHKTRSDFQNREILSPPNATMREKHDQNFQNLKKRKKNRVF